MSLNVGDVITIPPGRWTIWAGFIKILEDGLPKNVCDHIIYIGPYIVANYRISKGKVKVDHGVTLKFTHEQQFIVHVMVNNLKRSWNPPREIEFLFESPDGETFTKTVRVEGN